MSGTAWRCMFVPMDARVLSSCSKNGMSEVEIERICRGDTSTCVTSRTCARPGSPALREEARVVRNSPNSEWSVVDAVLLNVTARSDQPDKAGNYYRRTITVNVKPRNLLPR